MSEGAEEVINLRSQITCLQNRVRELEEENAKFSSRLSRCRCNELQEKMPREKSENLGEERGEMNSGSKRSGRKKATRKTPGYDTRIMNHHPRRYVALKVMYFGQRFYGFSQEAQMDPSIESEIFKALETTRLLIGDKKEIQYSRCGRTDKGVSAFGQRETVPEEQDGPPEGEIDYVRVLNGVLPKDIRIVGWCPVSSDFSARFSCLSREYKYFFWGDNLNLSVMETAGKKLIGEHDFRNFCKMDALNVHTYRRNVMSFKISPCDMRFEGHQLYAIKIKGRAFLWHQVRCIVAVLFMIGQGLESPEVIDALLDTRTLRKPQYLMAPEIPLVLLSYAGQALHVHLENECRLYQLQAAIFREALLSLLPLSTGAENKDSSSNGVTRKKASHVPLMSRETEPSYEERRAKLETAKLRA
ncbi:PSEUDOURIDYLATE SYNTHASE [Salix viminalis]|uniref:tRNA pseudouridine synthase n=1 Tax=Salix viminalis TaxID=40686 RepID=A0A9Q0UIW3_SALVM|nr:PSEUDOURIDYLATE SYNTHASE [Salix viminalis]